MKTMGKWATAMVAVAWLVSCQNATSPGADAPATTPPAVPSLVGTWGWTQSGWACQFRFTADGHYTKKYVAATEGYDYEDYQGTYQWKAQVLTLHQTALRTSNVPFVDDAGWSEVSAEFQVPCLVDGDKAYGLSGYDMVYFPVGTTTGVVGHWSQSLYDSTQPNSYRRRDLSIQADSAWASNYYLGTDSLFTAVTPSTQAGTYSLAEGKVTVVTTTPYTSTQVMKYLLVGENLVMGSSLLGATKEKP